MTYIEEIATIIHQQVQPDADLHDDERGLYLIYAVLALAIGENVTGRHVHDAWSAWKAMTEPEHESIKPFDELNEEVQGEDQPFVSAIRDVAGSLRGEIRGTLGPRLETSPYEVPAEIQPLLVERLADAEDEQVFLIPRGVEDGVAIYQDSHTFTVKDLKAAGVRAAFLAESQDRAFVSEFSHDVIYQIAIGIASNLTWDAAKTIWTYVHTRCEGLAARSESPRVRLQVAKLSKGDVEIEGLTLEGPATEEIPEALLALLVGTERDD